MIAAYLKNMRSLTGQTAIKAALAELGFRSYHMSEVFVNWKSSHFQYWQEALQAKYKGQGRRYGPEQFKKIFAEYDVSL